jgi:hypothetical protein
MGPRAGLDDVKRRKVLPHRDSNSDPSAIQRFGQTIMTEDGGSRFFRNVDTYLPTYRELHSERPYLDTNATTPNVTYIVVPLLN